MSSSHHKDGALFIHLQYRPRATPDECQWGLYLHQSDEEGVHTLGRCRSKSAMLTLELHSGGTLYQIKTTETRRVANYSHIKDVFHDHGELRAIGYVTFWKFEHTDGIVRCLHNRLDHLKEKTSLRWVLMMAVQLMEDRISKMQNHKKLKSEMVDWVNRERAPSDSEGDEESEEEAKSRAGMEVQGKGVDGAAGEAQEQILGKIEGDLTQ